MTSTTDANSTVSPPPPPAQTLLGLQLQAGPVPAGAAAGDHQRRFFEVYGSIAAANAALALLRSFLFAYGGVRAARVVHDHLLQAVLKVRGWRGGGLSVHSGELYLCVTRIRCG